MKKYVDRDKLQEYTTKLIDRLTNKYNALFATKDDIGSPLVAETAAQMTDTNKVYVYIGSETGYTSGNWYYYDGSTWVSGGIYNAVATDDSLMQSGAAADAKIVGDKIRKIEPQILTAFSHKSVSGKSLLLSDGANNIPMQELIIQIEPEQSGTGNPTKTNIRPISGWGSAFITIADEDDDTQKTHTISFGEAGTVYKGTLNVLSGQLIVTHKYAQLSPSIYSTYEADGTDSWWSVSGTDRRYNYASTASNSQQKRIAAEIKRPASDSEKCSLISNMFVAVTSNDTYARRAGMSVSSANGQLQISFGGTIMPLADLHSFLLENPITICYELANYITYQLSPVEVTTILGVNNISVNCGTMDLTYCISPEKTDMQSEAFLDETNAARLYFGSSGGRIRYYSKLNKLMNIYTEIDGNLTISKAVEATDYIPIQNANETVNIFCLGAGTTSISGAEYYIYFYDENKNPVWTILNDTDAITGEKNKINNARLREIGFQFANIPVGYYVRIGKANSHNVAIIVWQGGKFGVKPTAVPYCYDENGALIKLPESNVSGIQVPSDVYFIIAKPGYTFLDMYTVISNTKEQVSEAAYRFPTQCLYLGNFAGSGRVKNIMIVKDYNYNTGEYSNEQVTGDLSDYVTFVQAKKHSNYGMAGYANQWVKQKIDNLIGIKWECKKNITDVAGTGRVFREGIVYSGIPYRSRWQDPHWVGWHVSKHTFINAANDPDSIFYNHERSNPNQNNTSGPYYSLVCSSFGTLVAGWEYPATNDSLMHDPNNFITKNADYPTGTLITNGYGHCFVVMEKHTNNSGDVDTVRLAEEIGPYTAIRNIYNDVSGSYSGIGPNLTYLQNYQYSLAPKKVRLTDVYDIQSGTIKNGSARPHRGDRGVYTSAMDVKINIKDETANRLYYQKFNMTCTHGVPSNITAIGDPMHVDIPTGTTQYTLRSATTNGIYTGVALEDGAIYGVWASNGDSQPIVPSNVEYFEWYDITTNPIVYQITNGIFITDDVFWYAVVAAKNYKNYYNEDSSDPTKYKVFAASIPYEAPGKDIAGNNIEHSDYSKYADSFFVTSVMAIFKKGKFGAYVVNAVVDEQDIPEDDSNS